MDKAFEISLNIVWERYCRARQTCLNGYQKNKIKKMFSLYLGVKSFKALYTGSNTLGLVVHVRAMQFPEEGGGISLAISYSKWAAVFCTNCSFRAIFNSSPM